jgi:hypothetical protein
LVEIAIKGCKNIKIKEAILIIAAFKKASKIEKKER